MEEERLPASKKSYRAVVEVLILVFTLLGMVGCIPALSSYNMSGALLESEFQAAVQNSFLVVSGMIISLSVAFTLLIHHLFQHIFIRRAQYFYEYLTIIMVLLVPPSIFLPIYQQCKDCPLSSITYTLFDMMTMISNSMVLLIIYKKCIEELHELMSVLFLTYTVLYNTSIVIHNILGFDPDRSLLSAYSSLYTISMLLYLSLAIMILQTIQERNVSIGRSWNNPDLATASLLFSIILLEFSRFATSPSSTTIAYWENYTEGRILAVSLIQSIFTVFVIILPMSLETSIHPEVSLAQRLSMETKAPLDVINMGLEILDSMNADKTSRQSQVIQSLLAFSNSMNTAVGKQIDDAKQNNVELVLNQKKLELIPFLSHQISVFEVIMNERRIKLFIKVSDDIPKNAYLSIDQKLVTQVFQNILSHMIKSLPKGSSIEIEAHLNQDESTTKRRGSVKEDKDILVGTAIIEIKECQLKTSSERAAYDTAENQDGWQIFRSIFELSSRIISLHGGNLRRSSLVNAQGCSYVIELPLFEPLDEVKPAVRMTLKEAPRDDSALGSINSFIRRPSLLNYKVASDNHMQSEPDCKHFLIVVHAITTKKLVSQLVAAGGNSYDNAADGTSCVSMIKRSLYEGGKYFDCVMVDYMMPNLG